MLCDTLGASSALPMQAFAAFSRFELFAGYGCQQLGDNTNSRLTSPPRRFDSGPRCTSEFVLWLSAASRASNFSFQSVFSARISTGKPSQRKVKPRLAKLSE